MSFSEWLLLLSACLVISISPGPGALISMRQGIRFGPAFALYTVLGLQIGVLFQIGIIFFGIGVIILSSTVLFKAVTLLGAVYLCVLGIRQIWYSKQHTLITEASTEHNSKRVLHTIVNAVIIDSTNIKGMVLFLALFSQFISGDTTYTDYGIITFTIIIVDALIMCMYALFAAKLRIFLQSAKQMQVFNIITGCLFILLALLLVIT